MNIETLSVVVGTRACDAKCPFCISKLTGFEELPKNRATNYRNLEKAANLARIGGASTVLITGKGEPTLYPRDISNYVRRLGVDFPIIELQTNGLSIGREVSGISKGAKLSDHQLKTWYDFGLDVVAISTVGIDPELNSEVYSPGKEYIDLAATIARVKSFGFTCRMCVGVFHGGVDSKKKVDELVDFCVENKVDQLTFRPITMPDEVGESRGQAWFDTFGMLWAEFALLAASVTKDWPKLRTLKHGAEVYSVSGVSVSVTNCLTTSAETDDIRTLIYYSNGRVSYDWQHKGATILSGE